MTANSTPGVARRLFGPFLTGLLFILPVVLTVAIVGWLVGVLDAWIGPDSWFGDLIARAGAMLGARQQHVGFILGLTLALGGIWLLGFVVQTRARALLERLLHGVIDRVPLLGALYRSVEQVVGLLRERDDNGLRSMAVVLCRFGDQRMLGLLTSTTPYLIDGVDSRLVYLPGSPLPMSGALVFVPEDTLTLVTGINVEEMMRIYVSFGVLGGQVVPAQFRRRERDVTPAAE